MRKIGIITLNTYNNYGAVLQNYALQKFINSLSSDNRVITIWYKEDNYMLRKKFFSLIDWRKLFLNKNNYRDFINNNYLVHKMLKAYNIKKFCDEYIYICFEYGIPKDLDKKYDYFIVGSDQIWSPNFVDYKNEFLQFADKDKRIAYAASFGVCELDSKIEKIIKNGLKEMKYISVREDEGAVLVKRMIGKDVDVVLDPTMLLPIDVWNSIAKKPVWHDGSKYILSFFLSYLPDELKSSINEFAIKNNLKIIDLMDITNVNYYCSTPQEFLYLIKHATAVYTDSFHGTVFSILWKKPFITCLKEYTDNDVNSRIFTLLRKFKLKNRIVSKNNNYKIANLMEIEFPDVEAILERERQKSKEFLCKALNIKG